VEREHAMEHAEKFRAAAMAAFQGIHYWRASSSGDRRFFDEAYLKLPGILGEIQRTAEGRR
jgi:hypothetical protein